MVTGVRGSTGDVVVSAGAADDGIIEDSIDEASDICEDIADDSIIEESIGADDEADEDIADEDDESWANAPVARMAARAVPAINIRIMIFSVVLSRFGFGSTT
jgi:hypothetical protein